VEIIPVDSEHSALWQALNFKKTGFKKLILTASGGPFREAKICDMRHFSAKDALAHPNWSMGKKITIDCATMLNKGFEIIEAHHLFSAPLDKIDVIVHPQSIIHSMVEFEDNSILAEMSVPDMRQPIQMALTYPEKKASLIKPLDLISLGKLEFFPVDRERFPCFNLAIEALKMGDNFPTALNASSEVAVQAFLEDRILFTDIAEVISHVLSKTDREEVTLPALLNTDMVARCKASAFIKQIENRR
jgi:1-deoxy-D-xylulose-5-phosphate reductoisomerase